MIQNQYYRVRDQDHCVACGKEGKPVGLLLHTECHDRQKARNDGDYSKRVWAQIDALERALQVGDP